MKLTDTIREVRDLLTSFEVLRTKSPDGGAGQHDVIRATVMRIVDGYLASSGARSRRRSAKRQRPKWKSTRLDVRMKRGLGRLAARQKG